MVFLDRAWPDGRGAAWLLHPDHLEVVPASIDDDRASDHRLTKGGFEADLASLLGCGAGLAKAVERGLRLKSEPTDAPGSWRATGVLPALGAQGGEDRWLLEGGWVDDPSGGFGTVSRCRFERADSAGRVTVWEEVVCMGWSRVLDRPFAMASEARHTGSMPEMHVRLTLVGLGAFTPAEFESLVALPEADGVDPVRGPAAFTSIIDHRGDERRQIDRAEGKPLLMPPEPLVSASARQSRLVIGGWILAGAIVATLVFLRMRRGN